MVKLAHKANTNAAGKLAQHVSFTTTKASQRKPKEIAVEEMNRKQLEGEVKRLKGLLTEMRTRVDVNDKVTGLPKRARFMELAGAEFNRTRRYNHDLTLVVAKVSGHQRVLKKYGEEAADHVMTCVAEMCTSSTRLGVDILGRSDDDKIAMLLPETDLQGGEKCLARIRKLVTSLPITIDGEPIKVGMVVAARPLRKEHTTFAELLASA